MQAGESIRIAMGVEYDGGAFHGWQTQESVRTVQQEVERAVSRVANHPVKVHCAGRTDAGVHAEEQVVHLDTSARRTERSWVLGTNANLPPDVAIVWAMPVDGSFHARFSAVARYYRYLVQTRPARSPLERDRAVWVHRRLDLGRMQEAAQSLIGEHDFSSFRALACQARSPVRRVHQCRLHRYDDLLELRIGANGFLHHMVRNIAGVLMTIGRGDAPVTWVRELLQVRDRSVGGVTAPPQGLYFLRAQYPQHFGLPQRPIQASSRRL